MTEKYQYFNGMKFTRDEKTGYYLNSTNRIRMHRYVWLFYNGEIPKGYHIHHIDGDKSNNNIKNLQMIEGKKHIQSHSKRWHEEHETETRISMEEMQDKAKEWHKSNLGLKWHKENYENNVKPKLNPTRIRKCDYCGTEYVSRTIHGRFCSGKCKTAWGRKYNRKPIKRICENCSKEFESDNYSNARFCPECRFKKK